MDVFPIFLIFFVEEPLGEICWSCSLKEYCILKIDFINSINICLQFFSLAEQNEPLQNDYKSSQKFFLSFMNPKYNFVDTFLLLLKLWPWLGSLYYHNDIVYEAIIEHPTPIADKPPSFFCDTLLVRNVLNYMILFFFHPLWCITSNSSGKHNVYSWA